MGHHRKGLDPISHSKQEKSPPLEETESQVQFLKEKIFQTWLERVHQSSLRASPLSSHSLTAYLPGFLDHFLRLLMNPDPEAELRRMSHLLTESQARKGEKREFTDLGQILQEFHLLQQSILEVLETEGPSISQRRNLLLNGISIAMQFTFFDISKKEIQALAEEKNKVMARKLKEEVQEIERKTQQLWLEEILERFPIAVVLIDPQGGQVIYANHEAEHLTGSFPTTLNKDAGDGFYASDLQGNPIPVSEMMRFRVARGEKLRNYEIYWKAPNRNVPLLVTGELLPAMLGHPSIVLLAFQDITEQVQARETLRKSEEKFRALSDTLPQFVWTASANGDVDYLNRRWMDYTGAEDLEAECRNWLERVHPEDREETMQVWRRCIENGISLSREHRIRNKNGNYHWFLEKAVPIFTPEKHVDRWFGTCTDIDQQKKVMAAMEDARRMAEAANQTKSSFLANVSHEIRTPLGAILGFTDLLKEGNLEPDERRHYFEVIERNGNALTSILNDVLDLSKVEAGHLQIVPSQFSLKSLLSETMDLFRDQAQGKGLRFEDEIQQRTPDLICSDPARLRQILVNLIGNAIKFTAQGKVKILVSSKARDSSHHEFRIEIDDTGPGLTSEQASQLFRPFTQADNSIARKFGGTGLGLVLSKRLAQALSGDVKLKKCEPNKGCSFEVSFLAEVLNS
jgi:PAS domain S-box-containing protein